MKSAWYEIVADFTRRERRAVSKRDFPPLLSIVWKKYNSDNGKGGFKKCGIYPYNSQVVSSTSLRYCEPFSSPNTQQTDTQTQQADTPTQQADTLTQQADTPTQQTYTQSQQADILSQQAYTSTQQADTPTQRPYTPTQQMHTPTQQQDTSTQQLYTQTQQLYTPTQQLYTPTQQLYTPTQQLYTPTQPPYTLTQQLYTPTQPPYTLTQQMHTPSQQPDTSTQQHNMENSDSHSLEELLSFPRTCSNQPSTSRLGNTPSLVARDLKDFFASLLQSRHQPKKCSTRRRLVGFGESLTSEEAMDKKKGKKGKESKGKGKRRKTSDDEMIGKSNMKEQSRAICLECETYYDMDDGDDDWIECAQCMNWYHASCVGIQSNEMETIEFACRQCT